MMTITDLNTRLRHAASRIIILIAAVAVLQSCSSKSEKLLQCVPFDAEAVMTVNLIKLASGSGLTVSDGKLTLPDEYASIKEHIPASALSDISEIASAVDLECIVAFSYIKGERAYATAFIKDADALRDYFKTHDIERGRHEGFETYGYNDYSPCFVIDESESQLWFISNSKRISDIADFELSRKKNNITKYDGLMETLNSGAIAGIAVDQTALQSGMDNYWGVMKIGITDNAISLAAKCITYDGEEFRNDIFQPVDTDFLRYMPANFIYACALGVKADSRWTSVLEAVTTQLGGDRSAFNEALPYLKSIDGTVAFGFGPKNKRSLLSPDSPQQWQALLMAHMPQSKIADLSELMRSYLAGSAEVGNGLYRFTSREFYIDYGNINGNFAIAANTTLEPDKVNPFGNDFNGKPFAMVFQTPILSTLVNAPGLDYSIKLLAQLNGNTLNIDLKLVGTDSPIIPTLVSTLPVFAGKYGQTVKGQ